MATAVPKLTSIIGGVTEAGVATGLIGYFDSAEVKARMTFPLAYISENPDEVAITGWPALIINVRNQSRALDSQARSAQLDLQVYMKEHRGEVADREIRQLCADIEQQINIARRGGWWGAKVFRWERQAHLGVGDIQGFAEGIVAATVTYTVLFVEQYV